jgi:Flp pilus assembly protein TadB
MSDEFGNWDELSRLWHAHTETMTTSDVERRAGRKRTQMLALATGEVAGMALSFIAAAWIAMQTTMVALTAIVVVFYGVCAFMQHRLRREPPANGGVDLLSSLDLSIAREEWNLAQFAIGRAVTFLTLFSIVMVAADHLRSYTTTPAARLWALLAVTGFVLVILASNIVLTRRARDRKQRLERFASQMRGGSEARSGVTE